MSGLSLAIAVAVAGLVISALWFGISRRRKAETEIGIQSLAHMKWRDCIAVVLEALYREGYVRGEDGESSGSGGTEIVLLRGDEKVLLGYKHGTAYHLTDSNVREFVNTISLYGARTGILLTLGSAEGNAGRVAASHGVQLITGADLWRKVRQYVNPKMLEDVRRQAAARTRQGLWTGAAVSLVAGALAYFLGGSFKPASGPVVVASADVAPLQANPTTHRSDTAMLEQINATARAMAEVAKLSDVQLAQRRVAAARQVALLPQVDSAQWSAQRTLLVTLNRSDDKDQAVLDEVCRILVQNEEMRFTRVQLESPTVAGQAVRWRLCD